MEVCDIVQEAVIKTTLEKKKCKKAKWLSDEALQIAEKRRKPEGKAEKEIYIYPFDAEFQWITQRDEIAFLSDQCKEIEENNRMERLEISSRKWDIKGLFHVKMGTMKDWNRMDLKEAEDIKKRWPPYTENYTKTIFMTQITTIVWSLT